MASPEDSSLSTDSKLSDVLKRHPDVLDKLALCLDRNMRLIPNWKHLARELNVDEDVIKKLEQYKDHSPTIRLFEYLEVKKPQLTIQQLRSAMSDIRRNDLSGLLTTKGGFTGSEKVQVLMSSQLQSPSGSLLDEIALALDATSPVLANWYHLAIKLGVPQEYCWNFERRSLQSPTNDLFQYLEATRPLMTLKELKETLHSMERNDLLEYLTSQDLKDGAPLKDVMTPGSELLQTMADKLNREIPEIKDWHHLACKLNVPVDIRQAFGGLGPKRKSPTEEVMLWLAAQFPDTTLNDVVKALDKIQRNDAIQIITRQFPDTVDSSLEPLVSSFHDKVSISLPINDPTGETFSARYKGEECGSLKGRQILPGSQSSPGPGKPRTLPCLTTHFIGRKEEVEKIIEKLRTDRLRMIEIISAPGMGKTEVAIRVSHLLKFREPTLSVIYVDRQDKLTDICGEILDRLHSRPWSICDDLISQAKRKLSELQKDTVIVLDNTGDVQGKKFDDFAQRLVKSAPNVQLIITTRQDVGFVSADVHKVQLGPLDVNLSAELLRKLDVSCGEKQVEVLGKLCGGIPLLLVNCACLLKDGFNPEVLIRELRNNPIRLLESNAKEIYDALGRFVKKFSKDLIKNLVVLSVFPSTFSPKDIEFLFDDQLQLETIKTKMLKCALLQKMNDQKLGLHPLLQAYCRTERESLHMADVGCNAQSKFNQHYLELLKSLSKTFITKDSALVAIQTMRDQKVNIIEALKNCFEDANDTDQQGLAIDVVNSTEVLDFLAKVLSPPKECVDLYRKCRDIAKSSNDQRRYAESLNSLGFRRLCDAAHSKGEPEGSRVTLQLFQEAYEIRRTLPEEDNTCQTHAHTISKLGLCHVLEGDVENGRDLIQQGIGIREELGVSLYTAAGNWDLGNSYRLSGDNETAIEIWKRNTLPVYKEELGGHPWTASILHYIGDSYKSLATESSENRYAVQAEMYFQQALELRERLLGCHQDTALSRVCLSDVLVVRGDFQSALNELNKTLKIQQELLGPQHKNTNDTRNKRSDLLVKMGRKDKTVETQKN